MPPLLLNKSLDYDFVKATVLRAYELVPEAYRQKFRNCGKDVSQTYVEFAREKELLFDKWCQASKITNFKQLRELVLLEEFKRCLPERIVVYLNEQKVTALAEAAACSDEFVLIHKGVILSPAPRESTGRENKTNGSPKVFRRNNFAAGESRECFYCREPGHLIAVCPVLKQRDKSRGEVLLWLG